MTLERSLQGWFGQTTDDRQVPRGTVSADRLQKTFAVAASRPGSIREWVQGLLVRRPAPTRDVTALHDVSFAVAQGEALGVVGPNGSGKSTLLKLLAGTMAPDSGTLTLGGRVSALIELGAGFHPEFTGRENVFLSGAILGMRRSEMTQRFDDIVAFAELQEFMDIPVKYYSSGMFARLGFAVASSIEPDILLIDEVLAVGDERFQPRCLHRLEQLRAGGTTIVFVSHSLPLVQSVCEQALWLDRGVVRALGAAGEVLAAYQTHAHRWPSTEPQAAGAASSLPVQPEQVEPAPPLVTIAHSKVVDEGGEPCRRVSVGDSVTWRATIQCTGPVHRPAISINIVRQDGVQCFGTTRQLPQPPDQSLPESWEVEMRLPQWQLLAGLYHFDVSVGAWEETLRWQASRSSPLFEVVGDGGPDAGVFRPAYEWSVASLGGTPRSAAVP